MQPGSGRRWTRDTFPVVSTVGCDRRRETIYNINADTAAAKIAGRAGGGKPDLHDRHPQAFYATGGRPRHADSGDSHGSDAPGLITRRHPVSGGMIPKVECCMNAMRRGVNRVFIIDGRIPHAILIEMLTNEGIGTMFLEGLRRQRSEGGTCNAPDIQAAGQTVYRGHLRAVCLWCCKQGKDVTWLMTKTAKEYIDLYHRHCA